MPELKHYLTEDGHDPFQSWLNGLKKKDRQAVIRITTRLNRLAAGNPGDHKSVGDGIVELRITYGPAYRVYYSSIGEELVLLLIGGDKGGGKKQQSEDIATAKKFLADHQRRYL